MCSGCFFFSEDPAVKNRHSYFTPTEIALWSTSVLGIVLFFLLFDRENYTTLIASLIGVTSLIFNAKGNPIGQALMVVFSLLYGGISYTFAYYGEMITYLGMTLPMAVVALVAWLRHPFRGNRAEVEVQRLSSREWGLAVLLTLMVTVLFSLLLFWLDTAHLLPSSLSVATSFLAVYLTFRRSPYFALVYAANDLVLILLWILASLEEIRYLSVVICFLAFLANDLYGFLQWRRMERRQAGTEGIKE